MQAGREAICTYEDKQPRFRRAWRSAEHAAAGLNDTRIAERVGCSIWIVRKWQRRSIHQGRVGFKSHMGRPTTGPLSTFAKELQETILHPYKLCLKYH